MRRRGPTTTILHADREAEIEHGALHKPMHSAVAYEYRSVRDLAAVFQGERAGHVYGRQGNPTSEALERRISLMEDAVGTVCFSTGMAAIASLLVSMLREGDHIVSSRFLFGNTHSLLRTLQGIGCEVSFVDATEAAHVEEALRPRTRLVFVETIANPNTQVADLESIGALCRKQGLVYVVDNTLTTPHFFQPKSVGASLVVHSLTKQICGHGDALGGSVSDTGLYDWSAFENIQPIYRRGPASSWALKQIRKKGLRDVGATLCAEHAHRISRGAETLALRMERASSNALRLAKWLASRPEVAEVHFPGLPGHAQHERAARLFGGFGTLFSFEFNDGIDCFDWLDALQLVVRSSHLGDARTLAIPMAHTIMWEMGAEARREIGVTDSLVRVSVGIEDCDDLIADFEAAFSSLSPLGRG